MNDKIQIVSIFPNLLGTYGDGGNLMALQHIAALHGIETTVTEVAPGESIPSDGDLYILGGGEDTAQVAAAQALREDGTLSAVAADGIAVLAICAGYQLLGHEFPDSDGKPAPGVGILDVKTDRLPARAVGELLVQPTAQIDGTPLLNEPLTGFENHAGATHVGPGSQPLAHIVPADVKIDFDPVLTLNWNATLDGQAAVGIGNGDGTEGATSNRTIGTYLHGPCLARNPELAELLLGWAAGRKLEPIREPEVEELRKVRLTAAANYDKTTQTQR